MRERFDEQPKSKGDDPSVHESKRAALINGISKRLRPICSRMPAAEFDAMVREMVDIELKYAEHAAPTHLDRAD